MLQRSIFIQKSSKVCAPLTFLKMHSRQKNKKINSRQGFNEDLLCKEIMALISATKSVSLGHFTERQFFKTSIAY